MSVVPTVVGVLLAFVLGLWAKPWWEQRQELRLLKREIYCELARYIANLERVKDLEYDEARQVVTTKPRFDVMDWYKDKRLDLLLRIDSSHALRLLYDSLPTAIILQYEEANSPRNATFGLPGRVKDLVSKFLAEYGTKIDRKLLQRCIEEAHAEHAKWKSIVSD